MSEVKRLHLRLAGVRCDWPERVPASATFEEEGRNDYSIWGRFMYRMGSAAIGWSLRQSPFDSPGAVSSERYFDRNGLRCGLEVERGKGGGVRWQVPWVRGRMHGIARQFDESGRQILRTRFVRGSGVDLYSNGYGINELRMYRNNHRHGIERWGHPRLPYEESHFLQGRASGVFRRWKGAKLEKGYPKYFVDDKEVTSAVYRKACRTRPELPRDSRKDDRCERPPSRRDARSEDRRVVFPGLSAPNCGNSRPS
jgi:hypothetical protein